jgi:hypothetical protein
VRQTTAASTGTSRSSVSIVFGYGKISTLVTPTDVKPARAGEHLTSRAQDCIARPPPPRRRRRSLEDEGLQGDGRTYDQVARAAFERAPGMKSQTRRLPPQPIEYG